MSYLQPSLPVFLAIGLLAGISAGLFGVGGGIVIVPLLTLLLAYPQHVANGTSLVALLLPVGALGVWQYYQSGKISPLEVKSGLWIGLGIFVGALLGAKIATALPADTLKKVFAVFLAAVAVKLWFFG
jgi:uncharacterized membrane protein YfcA